MNMNEEDMLEPFINKETKEIKISKYYWKELNENHSVDEIKDCFVKHILNGDIVITFKIGVFKSGQRIGQIHDRGTDFSINEKILINFFLVSSIRLVFCRKH